MQEFKTTSAMIVSAKARNVLNASGDYVEKAIISLDRGLDVFAPMSALNNMLDKVIQPSDLMKLRSSTLYYIESNVKAGDTFSFVEGGEIQPEPAQNPLHITTLKGIIPTDTCADFLETLPIYVQDMGDGSEGSGFKIPTDYTALKDEINALTNVANARALVQAYDVFDNHADAFADLSTADTYKATMLEIIDTIEE